MPDITEDPIMGIFVVIFLFVVWGSLLNFFLAIIVEAYMQARGEVESFDGEDNVILDLLAAGLRKRNDIRHDGLVDDVLAERSLARKICEGGRAECLRLRVRKTRQLRNRLASSRGGSIRDGRPY